MFYTRKISFFFDHFLNVLLQLFNLYQCETYFALNFCFFHKKFKLCKHINITVSNLLFAVSYIPGILSVLYWWSQSIQERLATSPHLSTSTKESDVITPIQHVRLKLTKEVQIKFLKLFGLKLFIKNLHTSTL